MFKLLAIFSVIYVSNCVDTSSFLFKEIIKYHNDTNIKSEHANQVVTKIYNAFRQWFFTITFCDFTYFENRILRYTEISGNGYPVLLLNGCPDQNRTRVKPKINIHGQTAYVITAKVLSLEGSEYVVDALLRTGVFKPRSAVIFVLNEPVKVDNYFYYTMKSHFQFLWSRRITNSVVLISWEGHLRTFTYNSFYDNIIDITDVKDISRMLSHLYDNLYGHELRLSVFKKITAYDDYRPVLCDSRLAATILNQLNATCKPLVPRDGNTVGDLLDNGIATGVTADLIDGYTDLELSSRILKNSYYGYIDTTYPLLQDELCFMVKSSDKQSTFMTIIDIISVRVLLIFNCNVIVFMAIALIALKVESTFFNMDNEVSIGTTIIDLTKCFIRQTFNMKFNGPVYRSLVLMIILYSLIIDCVIDGIITTAITYPRYKSEVNTLTELFESNLTIGIHNRHIKLFNRSLDDGIRDKLMSRIDIVSDKKITEIIIERQFQYALLLRKTDALNICRKTSNFKNGQPLFEVMRECPIPCSIVYGLRYGSPYLPKIDKIMLYLNQNGILNFWVKTEDYKANQNVLDPDAKYLKPLNWGNLQEVFIVWSVGLIISTVVFLIEMFLHWRQLARTNIITE